MTRWKLTPRRAVHGLFAIISILQQKVVIQSLFFTLNIRILAEICKQIVIPRPPKILWFAPLFGHLFFAEASFASFEVNGCAARYYALGKAYVGLANTPDAIFSNCSGLAQSNGPSLALFYTHLFGMKELTCSSFAAAFPTRLGYFGAGMINFGNESYHEQSFLLSYNQSIGSKFFCGLNLHYMKLQIDRYGSDFSTSLDLGWLLKITSEFRWGFFASNITRSNMGSNSEPLPQTFTMGFSYQPTDPIIFNLDLFKETTFPLELRAGGEYYLFQRIALRSGFSTAPAQFSAGVGLLVSMVEIDYAIATHADLGLTHYFSVQFPVKKLKDAQTRSQYQAEITQQPIIRINVNRANEAELRQIPGLSRTLARRIIRQRQMDGPFSRLEDLLAVKGLNRKLLEQLRPYLDISE
ncbi:MAG: helix-hairpin-helix domain-containing protein [candidate division KSB1 bacterium]|nr:helix-hairpin-helix domain-containing protein [candidate division KSB1 bacterium]MDZ7317600.1 helix-hairpin-helix domain-containing protein [candidate division KSB1 bacterium]MDZ7340303.1 helix-hairpin-helix domain-containing protein [candidate division KSB1 bacterium]